MRRPLISASALAVALATSAACSNDTTAPANAAVGTYLLRSVNNTSLPVPSGGGNGEQIVDEHLRVNADGTAADTVFYASPISFRTDVTAANWSNSGGLFRLSDKTSGGTIIEGSLSGSALTLARPGISKIYAKQ